MFGNEARQGKHQLAQKSNTIILFLNEDNETDVPDKFFKVKPMLLGVPNLALMSAAAFCLEVLS